MSSPVYLLQGATAPRSDDGDVLLDGLTSGQSYWDPPETVHMAQTGQFVRPLSFRFGEMLATDDARALMDAGLGGAVAGCRLRKDRPAGLARLGFGRRRTGALPEKRKA